MKRQKSRIILTAMIALAVALATLNLTGFTVSENEYAVLTRFGRLVRVIREPGLHFKAPDPVESVTRFSGRIQVFETVPSEMLTSEKKNMLVNAYVIWNIEDPELFMKTVRLQETALPRLDDIVRSETRNEIGLSALGEVITTGRDAISSRITTKVAAKAASMGIRVVDVRIKKVFFPRQNLASVFHRMSTERQKIATKYRSEGREEAMKIQAEAEKEKAIILAEGRKQAEMIRAGGEAKALALYARSIDRDPEFYRFMRSLEFYEKSLGRETTVVLPLESDLMGFLTKAPGERR